MSWLGLTHYERERTSARTCRIAEQERAAAAQAQEAAATSGRIGTEEDIRKAAAKSSPYSAPGGRWSSFRSYSVWQRSFMIWGFALRFFFKLWLVGKKFTYGKKVRRSQCPCTSPHLLRYERCHCRHAPVQQHSCTQQYKGFQSSFCPSEISLVGSQSDERPPHCRA